jgi:hypothetical protein
MLLFGAALASACSSRSPQTAAGAGGSAATGAGGAAAAGGAGGGADGGLDAGGDGGVLVGGPPARPFWCPEYQTGTAATPSGWVEIEAVVITVGAGGMSSPIQSCQSTGGSWSVSASGTEIDGVDETTMTFRIDGPYQGPGVYSGTLGQGLSASFSHDDVGPDAFASVPSSECELCINDDGLSGTVACWDLETPAGSSPEVGYIRSGAFTCPGALPKPAGAATVLPPDGLSSADILCHYLAKLGCPGRPPDASCVMHSDVITTNGPCSSEWSTWLGCLVHQRPSQYGCDSGGDGDVLAVASGACASELAALRACRAAPTGAGGSSGGSSGAGGSGGLNGLQMSSECAAFCAKVTSQCGFPCTPANDCILYAEECEAGARDVLNCAATVPGALFCATNNWAIVGCTYHDALCADGGTRD